MLHVIFAMHHDNGVAMVSKAFILVNKPLKRTLGRPMATLFFAGGNSLFSRIRMRLYLYHQKGKVSLMLVCIGLQIFNRLLKPIQRNKRLIPHQHLVLINRLMRPCPHKTIGVKLFLHTLLTQRFRMIPIFLACIIRRIRVKRNNIVRAQRLYQRCRQIRLTTSRQSPDHNQNWVTRCTHGHIIVDFAPKNYREVLMHMLQ